MGYVRDDMGFPLLVSEWMENGSAWKYVTSRPDLESNEIFRLVRAQQLGVERTIVNQSYVRTISEEKTFAYRDD